MTEKLRTLLLLAALLFAGLQAGTYFAWSTGVMPGLGRGDDRTFVAAFNQMNLAIVNPVFLLTFLGTPLLAAAVAVFGTTAARPLAIAATVLAVATLVVTFAANIPLNNGLAAVDPGAPADTLAAARAHLESAWLRWNAVRCLTSAAALVAVGWAALRIRA